MYEKCYLEFAYKNKRPWWHGRYELNNKSLFTPENAESIKVVYLPRLDYEDSELGASDVNKLLANRLGHE